MPATQIRPNSAPRLTSGTVYCPMCTHTVPATVLSAGRVVKVAPGQKCPRCSSTLDAGSVLHIQQAA